MWITSVRPLHVWQSSASVGQLCMVQVLCSSANASRVSLVLAQCTVAYIVSVCHENILQKPSKVSTE